MKPWYVITGGPSCGKTTMIHMLRERGHKTVDEAARELIDLELAAGRTLTEIRADELDFQRKVLRMKVATEESLPDHELTFFDRGIPDTTAYYRRHGFAEDAELQDALSRAVYKRVFVLDVLEFEQDYARVEDLSGARLIHGHLVDCYSELGLDVRMIPVLPAEKRVALILSML